MTQPGARSRSLGGCSTCRTRHMKCDEGRPTCSMCAQFGLSCGGYEIRLSYCFFNEVDGSAMSTSSSCRRPLFTEDERKLLSEELVASTDKPTTRLLFLLDEECEKMMQNDSAGLASIELSNGPFGIFKLAHTSGQYSPSPHDQSQTNGFESDSSPNAVSDWLTGQASITENVNSSGDILLDTALWDLTSNLGSTCNNPDFTVSTPDFLRCFTPDFLRCFTPGIRFAETQGQYEDRSSRDIATSDTPSLFNELNEQQMGSSLSMLSTGISHLMPPEATYLLSHYRNSVIGLLSPPAYHKTHWHILHLPSVMNTLAVLTLGDKPGTASLSIFFGILSISAFTQRSNSSENQLSDWDVKGEAYRLQAQQYLKNVLQEAFCEPKKAKYKEILMCLLTMVTVSMFSGHWEQTECYLLDAERFIRCKGLTKTRKSRKVRLLHHSYAYHRIFYESTHLLTDDTNLRNAHQRFSNHEALLGTCGQFFRLAQWSGTLDKKLLEKKSLQQGIDDIHLEIPGDFSETLYPDTFGIPESFLVLLSQVIRLGNEKDICDHNASVGTLSLQDFFDRATVLERCIIQWNTAADPHNREESSCQSLLGDTNGCVLNYYHTALHHALLIYFYRRIYNLDTTTLQKEVKETLNALLQYEPDDSGPTRYTSGIVWPGFIAASEALDPEVQDAFRSWFDRCVRRSGLKTFELSKSAVEKIWKRKREIRDTSISLNEFIKSQRIQLFYS